MQVRLTSVEHGGTVIQVASYQRFLPNKIYRYRERLFRLSVAYQIDTISGRDEIVFEEVFPEYFAEEC